MLLKFERSEIAEQKKKTIVIRIYGTLYYTDDTTKSIILTIKADDYYAYYPKISWEIKE